MSKSIYSLITSATNETDEPQVFSRKEYAVKAGDESGLRYRVLSASGKEVASGGPSETAAAAESAVTDQAYWDERQADLVPDQEPTKAEKPKKAEKAEPKLPTTEELACEMKTVASGHFWRVLGPVGIAQMEQLYPRLTFRRDNATKTVFISGSAQKERMVAQKRLLDAWSAVADSVPAFKKDHTADCNLKTTEGRYEQWQLVLGHLESELTLVLS